MTNPDTLDLFHRFGFEPIFIPFLINTRRYKPEPCDALPFEYVFFMPSRQIWRDKGNDLFVEAFAQFLKEYRDSLLVMVDWGIDKERTKMLVQKLEVQKSVLWVPLMSKPLLVRWYNRSTAILDQVVLGSYGTSAPEAMACEKPVLIYISQKRYLKTFGEVPPVLNVKQPQEILEAMIRCTDSSFRSHIGRLSREWVEKHHSPEVVINRHIFVMSKVIQGVDNQ
jgi:glycosyltransferase involved in cell wall biosynthesis